MQTQLTTSNLVSISKQNKVITTSRKIAAFFGKRHADVLRDIKNAINKTNKTNKTNNTFSESNFELSEYADKSGKSPVC